MTSEVPAPVRNPSAAQTGPMGYMSSVYDGFDRMLEAFHRTWPTLANGAPPQDIDSTKIEATIADGVLKVVAPRRAKAEPQKIQVRDGA
jgi:hypothetical protein